MRRKANFAENWKVFRLLSNQASRENAVVAMVAFKVGKENTIYLAAEKIVLVKPHHDDPSKTVVFLGQQGGDSFTVDGSAETIAKMIDAAQSTHKS